MAKAVGLPQNSYCLFAKVRASLPDSTPVCRSHRAGACRPPPRSCVCASVFFREKRRQSNGGRAAHLAILNYSIGEKHRALQAGSGLLKFKGGGTGLTWTSVDKFEVLD